MKLAVTLLCVLSSSSAASVPSFLQIPLTRVESFREALVREGKWNAYVSAKLSAENATGNVWAGQQTAHDWEDLTYIAKLHIGTSKRGQQSQEFRFLLDTGSANFWVLDQAVCNEAPKLCKSKYTFKSQLSRTYQDTGKPFSSSYGSGNTFSGTVGKDTVWLGDRSGIAILETPVGQVKDIKNPALFQQRPFDGIMGLARRCLPGLGLCSVSDRTVFQQAYEQGLVSENLFTITLKKDVPYDQPGGYFTWGGFDAANCKLDTQWSPVNKENGLWVFALNGVRFGDESAQGSWSVLSDTGNGKITGPEKVMKRFLASVHAKKEGFDYYVDCDQPVPPLVVRIGGGKFVVPAEQLVVKDKQDPRKCLIQLGICAESKRNQWVFGVPFIRSYCHVHDVARARIGFATPKPS